MADGFCWTASGRCSESRLTRLFIALCMCLPYLHELPFTAPHLDFTHFSIRVWAESFLCLTAAGRFSDVLLPIITGKKQPKQAAQDEVETVETVPEKKGQWVTTAPTGEQVGCKLDGTTLKPSKALVSYASDPESGQVMPSADWW